MGSIVHTRFLGLLGSARTTDVSASMRKLIEADWIERDKQFTGPTQQAKSCNFSLEHTEQLITQSYKLAKRLHRLPVSSVRSPADNSYLEPLVAVLGTPYGELQQCKAHISSLVARVTGHGSRATNYRRCSPKIIS